MQFQAGLHMIRQIKVDFSQ